MGTILFDNRRELSPRHKLVALVGLVVAGLLVASVVSLARAPAEEVLEASSNTVGIRHSSSKKTSANKTPAVIRVLCYGDSLTAGMSPPNREFFPYSTYLQDALNHTTDTASSLYQVDHIGLPGWTTTQFINSLHDLRRGLQSSLEHGARPPFVAQIVILLAGTNDLTHFLRGVGDEQQQDNAKKLLASNLMRLHEAAMEAGASHTVAVGIPPAAFQTGETARAKVATDITSSVNQHLKEHTTKNMTYMPFPFPFDGASGNWSPDGIHFSPQGYEVFGREVAPIVRNIKVT